MLISIFHRLRIWLSYVLLVLAGFLSFLFFRFPFNFARVIGKKNIPNQGKGVIFLANHDTMYDSFLIGGTAFFPRMIFYPSTPFVNFAAKENYFSTWYFRALMHLLRTEAVVSRDHALLMKTYVKLLKERNLLIFYQGGRSKHLDHIKMGPSFAIRNAWPHVTVIPVFHEGMDRIFSRGGPHTKGIWRWLPRNLFRRPTIMFGTPIDFTDILQHGNGKEVTDAINAKIINAITGLKAEYDRLT